MVTGGGSGLLAELLSVAGASATVLDAQVPYAQTALLEVLGRTPDQACSEETARALAMASFQRARRLASAEHPAPASADGSQQLFGFASTASLATDRPKRGAHRAHAALQTAASTFSFTWHFDGDREAEEHELVEHLWSALSTGLGLSAALTSHADRWTTNAPDDWQALILGESQAWVTAAHDGALLFPGAFNPLHEGHTTMLEIAEQRTGLKGAFELSVANVDKPFLDYREIETRLAQFKRPVWLTRLPTFVEKARHFAGASFVVGIDTLLRIADARYYGSQADLEAALVELDSLGTRFVVFGRHVGEEFLELDDVLDTVPARMAARCLGVSRSEFQNPISSTELRRGDR